MTVYSDYSAYVPVVNSLLKVMKSNSHLRHLTIAALLPGLRYIETASVHQNRTQKVAVWFDVEP